MLILLKSLQHSLASFLKARSGNVAIMFGLLIPVLVIGIGGAMEFTGGVKARNEAQNSLDAAVLAAMRSYASGASEQEAQQIGRDIVTASFEGFEVDTFSVEINFDADGSANGEITGTLSSFFTGMVFPDGIKFGTTARAMVSDTLIDIALVLDVSSSMKQDDGSGTRLSDLKQAANRFLNIIESSGINARVAVVPFTEMVNVGTEQLFVTGSNHQYFDYDPWAGCVFERSGTGMHSAAYNGSDLGDNGKWHAYLWPPEPDPHRNSPGTDEYCVNESDGTGDTYAPGPLETTQIPSWPGYEDVSEPTSPLTFGPNLNCVRHAITPLTSTLSDVRAAVNELTAPTNFGTLIAPGVAWGHRVLSPQGPFANSDDESSGGRKIMIVLTDGEQTSSGPGWFDAMGCGNYDRHSNGTPFYFDPGDFKLSGNIINDEPPTTLMTPYGYIRTSNPLGTGDGTFDGENADLSRLARDACDAAKDPSGLSEIELYTIGVTKDTAPGTTVHELLKDCASSPGKFAYISDTAKLNQYFETLAAGFTRLRIAN